MNDVVAVRRAIDRGLGAGAESSIHLWRLGHRLRVGCLPIPASNVAFSQKLDLAPRLPKVNSPVDLAKSPPFAPVAESGRPHRTG
jgi:hypothetical protein